MKQKTGTPRSKTSGITLDVLFEGSTEKVVEGADWGRLERAQLKNEIVPALVIGAADDGSVIYCDVLGARGIMPKDEFDWQKEFSNFTGFVGRRIYVLIKGLDRKNGLAAVSRKAARQILAAATFRRIKVGSEIDGLVTGVGDMAAFVDIGGVTAILPIREVSHGFVRDLHSVLSVDDRIKVKVLECDAGTGRVVLSTRAVAEEPWTEFCRHTKEGAVVLGRVAAILPERGLVFVTVKKGVDALAFYPRHLDLEVGKFVRCKVGKIDPKKRRVWVRIRTLVAGNVSASAQYL